MKVILISRFLATFILVAIIYSLYAEFTNGSYSFQYVSIYSLLAIAWYIFSVFALVNLFQLKKGGWILGNAWLVWSGLNRISMHVFLFYLIPSENLSYEEDGISFSIVYFLLDGILWFLLNRPDLVSYYKISYREQYRATLIPALMVFIYFVYQVSFYYA